jgi:hypothetical protein
VNVELLGITTATLKVPVDPLPVHENVTGNNTDALSVGEDIQKGGLHRLAYNCIWWAHLAGTGSAHESSQCTRFDITKDVVEQPLLTSLDGDGVVL